MDPRLLQVFQIQVALQCEAVLLADQRLHAALDRRPWFGDPTRHRAAWIAVQDMLNAAANVAKACWGAHGGKFSAEREPLRRSVQIEDSSPFRQVGMRNHFEH
jgi:hypothetical protein